MCAIVGVWNFDGEPVVASTLERMRDTMVHRGPDDAGLWIDGPVAFGHRRLSIRDLSPLGHQPLSDPSGRVVVTYNGEIYNDLELRRELTRDFGVSFRSTCDAEILPVGYLAWGEKLFERIEGMFAIGLWDSLQRRLILARDHVGIKPLFWSHSSETLRFASEVKAILADPAHPRTIDPAGLHRLLGCGYAGPDATTVTDIRQVEPGTVLAFETGRMTSRRFWAPRRMPRFETFDEALDTFLPLLDQVVTDHLVSDVPVGVLQSGGIDSTLVTMSLRDKGHFPLFTASFASQSHDEGGLAAAVARRTGSEHHVVQVDSARDAEETLAIVAHHFDGQVADESAGPLYLLTRALRRHAKVALSGDGGDEFFGGYPTYRATRAAAIMRWMLPPALLESAGRLAYSAAARNEERLPMSSVLARFLLGMAAGGRYAHTEWRRYLPHFLAARVYGAGLRPLLTESPFQAYRRAFDDGPAASLVERGLLADQRVHLPGGLLMKTDAMSMANGVEIRVPLLDRRIIEFAGACNLGLLVPLFGPSKPLLRGALERLDPPPGVLHAPKRGFNVPLAAMLRGALRELGDRLLERSAGLLEPYLLPDAIRRLWHEHRSGRRDHAYALWPIIHFVLWRERCGAR